MTINKYYVLVPQALEQSTHQDSDVASDMEAQRQQMVKEAQIKAVCNSNHADKKAPQGAFFMSIFHDIPKERVVTRKRVDSFPCS